MSKWSILYKLWKYRVLIFLGIAILLSVAGIHPVLAGDPDGAPDPTPVGNGGGGG